MTNGFTTWAGIGPIAGNVLVVVNSAPGDVASVSVLFGEVERHVPSSALHVISPPEWRPWLVDRGLSDAQILPTVDSNGNGLELNYFLESPDAILWTVPKQFSTVLGTASHSRYNEEVKEIFEQRVCLLLGNGRLLAHTLPHPYVFVFDVEALLRRMVRSRNVDAYVGSCRELVADLYATWNTRGRPASSDAEPSMEAAEVLSRHLGSAVLAFDEDSVIPLQRADGVAPIAAFVRQLRTLIHARDRLLEERSRPLSLRQWIGRYWRWWKRTRP